jgi:hypothetical protein
MMAAVVSPRGGPHITSDAPGGGGKSLAFEEEQARLLAPFLVPDFSEAEYASEMLLASASSTATVLKGLEAAIQHIDGEEPN